MALVADYGTSSEGEDFDEDETPQQLSVSSSNKVNDSPQLDLSSKTSKVVHTTTTVITPSLPSYYQDDDEDTENNEGTLSKFLPKPKGPISVVSAEDEGFEEIGPIPPKKIYGDEAEPEPSQPSSTSTYHNIKSQKVKGGPIRITAPSLKDFEDEEADSSNKRRFAHPSKKGSGLFAILPEPKGILGSASSETVSFLKKTPSLPPSSSSASTTVTSATHEVTAESISSSASSVQKPRAISNSLIPDSVKQRLAGKRPAPSKLDEIRNKYLKQEANVKIVSRSKKAAESTKTRDSDDSEEEGPSDFFSLDAVEEVDPEALEKLKLPSPDFNKPVAAAGHSWDEISDIDGNDEAIATSSSQAAAQDDLMKFVRNKKKGKGASDVNFIDVKADDLRPDSTEWLKTITDESAVPARRGKGLGGVQKRKHQITYLAFEAKAREQELQGQWAQNRATRRQTQMKYGF